MRRGTPAWALVAGPVLAMALLAGCSSGTPAATPARTPTPTTAPTPGAGSTYCRLLSTDFNALFDQVSGPHEAARAVHLLRTVAAAAPASVRDDWRTIGAALGRLRVALTRAAHLEREQRSGRLSHQQLRRRTARLLAGTAGLSTPQTRVAGRAVVANAQAYCGTELGG